MIKLEDLKTGDKVYGVCSDGLGLYGESIIYKELFMLDAYPNPCEAEACDGGLNMLYRSTEKYIFKTRIEAAKILEELQLVKAKELLNSEKFIDRLFECATSIKRLSKYGEKPIFELAIKLYKEKMFKI
jgi:hypothetical protein